MSADSGTIAIAKSASSPSSAPANQANLKAIEAIRTSVEIKDSHIEDVLNRYNEERTKRLRGDGSSQYVNPQKLEKLKHFQEDVWTDEKIPRPSLLIDGAQVTALIMGAGFGGLLFAARLHEIGITDILIVDSAGGFGGTWYWNRYPGLMCDVESYVYLPLLEEMDYMPERKYSSGNELRAYANRVAERYEYQQKAAFRTRVRSMTWDDSKNEWVVSLEDVDKETPTINVRAQFVIPCMGILNVPKLPGIPGIEDFAGHSFHTSRWDYQITGGSSEKPDLTELKDKVVGIVGTGATAVQVIPQLAKWAKELYVFQRTPSSVDIRDNKDTDAEWWAREIKGLGKGWQKKRMENFNEFLSDVTDLPPIDMVSDQWTSMRTFSALVGGRKVTADNMAAHIASLQAKDFPRQERIRARVDEIVQDKETAEALKPWYAGWCKRPCFHDEYLPAFNLPTVKLIDTHGRGIDSMTSKGPVVAGKEFPLDLLIFSTGFYTPAKDSPAARADISIFGRGGKSLDEKWSEGVATLHGVITHDFPNLFFAGPNQAGASANNVWTLDQLAIHVAYIISEAGRLGNKGKVIIEPTSSAEEQWTSEVVSRTAAFAALGGCTPSYLNLEGETDRPSSPEEMKKGARGAMWGEGATSFRQAIEKWRTQGGLEGLEVTVVQ